MLLGLYHSIYRADDQVPSQYHIQSVTAAHVPVCRLRKLADGEVADLYINRF